MGHEVPAQINAVNLAFRQNFLQCPAQTLSDSGTGGRFLNNDRLWDFFQACRQLFGGQRPHTEQPEDGCFDSLLFQLLGCRQHIVESRAVSNQGHLCAFPVTLHQTALQAMPAAFLIIAAIGASGVANGHWAVVIPHRPAEHILLFGQTGRIQNPHSRHLLQKADVKHAVVRGAVVAYQTRPVDGKHHMQVQQCRVLHDLVEAPL